MMTKAQMNHKVNDDCDEEENCIDDATGKQKLTSDNENDEEREITEMIDA